MRFYILSFQGKETNIHWEVIMIVRCSLDSWLANRKKKKSCSHAPSKYLFTFNWGTFFFSPYIQVAQMLLYRKNTMQGFAISGRPCDIPGLNRAPCSCPETHTIPWQGLIFHLDLYALISHRKCLSHASNNNLFFLTIARMCYILS